MDHKRRTRTNPGTEMNGSYRCLSLEMILDRSFTLGILLVFLWSKPVMSQLTATNASLIFYKQGEKGYYGNNVTFRSTYLSGSAAKAWLDLETPLPEGTLQEFYLMAYNYSEIDSMSARIRLQIWRPVKLFFQTMILVWQQPVQIPTSINGAMRYTYSINETVALEAGDRIGWTGEGDSLPICFEYAEGHRTLFTKIGNNSYPDVGQVIRFEPTYLPSVFSVAVSVDGNATGPSGNPGSTDTPGPVGVTSASTVPTEPTGASGNLGITGKVSTSAIDIMSGSEGASVTTPISQTEASESVGSTWKVSTRAIDITSRTEDSSAINKGNKTGGHLAGFLLLNAILVATLGVGDFRFRNDKLSGIL